MAALLGPFQELLGLKKKVVEEPLDYLGMPFAEILLHPRALWVSIGMSVAYLLLRSTFTRAGSKFAKDPAMGAHGLVFSSPFFYLAGKGIALWYFDDDVAKMDTLFGAHPGVSLLILTMVGVQLFDVPSTLLIGGSLATPTFIAHHLTVLWLSVMSLHYRFALYYAAYFIGVIELSTPFLAFVDLFRDFPKFAEAWPATNEVVRVLFALAFFFVRIVNWIPVSVAFWREALGLLFRTGPHGVSAPIPDYVILVWLTTHLGLTLLQWYWGTKILKAVYAMLTGDDAARAHEAKGA
eukprot:CAMPEP_0198647246 /NCGR_PEP_ID=MMETSP1467-20131203/2567_1 /TAXON_ID=1462469 /ORGANISM="unid. sp., Strain CCMP2135" /LENGTH=293 /DNA_ID=CAMNT_0044382863 /DNA_START=24 /DNA_END=905 /DNA_ORIENTATION=-